MEKIRASYEISRNAAILAGKSEYGRVEITIDPASLTPEQRAELIRCEKNRDGTIYLLDNNVDGSHNWDEPERPEFGEHTDDAPIILLNWRISVRAARKITDDERKARDQERAESKIQEILGDPSILKIERRNDRVSVAVGESSVPWHKLSLADYPKDPRVEAIIPAVQTEIDTANEERKDQAFRYATRNEEARIAKLAEEKKVSEAKADQIARWVADHGTDNQKKRFSVQLLPEAEIIDAIRAEAYAPLNELERYAKITASDFCTCDYNSDVDYDVEDAESVSAAGFEKMEAVHALLPEAKITLRRHVGKCSACEESLEWASLRVELTIGAFEFSREYAA